MTMRLTIAMRVSTAMLLAAAAMPCAAADEAPKTTGSVTGYWYAMRDQPDFGVGVAALNHGPLRFEARYNYEARKSTSLFAGWKFAGGDEVSYEVTPILGGLFGDASGVIPGVEASVAWRNFDVYVEAEYVFDLDVSDDSYFYVWSELGWRPVEWLRLGLVGQRTRVVDTDRDIQRGVFAQVFFGAATVSLYAFNPDAASRYVILSLGLSF
jgi:hypothetical protein